jgi:hypothetical protein
VRRVSFEKYYAIATNPQRSQLVIFLKLDVREILHIALRPTLKLGLLSVDHYVSEADDVCVTPEI